MTLQIFWNLRINTETFFENLTQRNSHHRDLTHLAHPLPPKSWFWKMFRRHFGIIVHLTEPWRNIPHTWITRTQLDLQNKMYLENFNWDDFLKFRIYTKTFLRMWTFSDLPPPGDCGIQLSPKSCFFEKCFDDILVWFFTLRSRGRTFQ